MITLTDVNRALCHLPGVVLSTLDANKVSPYEVGKTIRKQAQGGSSNVPKATLLVVEASFLPRLTLEVVLYCYFVPLH